MIILVKIILGDFFCSMKTKKDRDSPLLDGQHSPQFRNDWCHAAPVVAHADCSSVTQIKESLYPE